MVCHDCRMGSRVEFDNGIVRYIVIALGSRVDSVEGIRPLSVVCLAAYVVSSIARVSSSGRNLSVAAHV